MCISAKPPGSAQDFPCNPALIRRCAMALNAPEMLKTLALCTAAAFGLSACLANDAERGLAGAAGGAVIGGMTGGSPVTGAVVGGAAGYFCRDLRVPGCVE
jgi:osmotically inducible lipoprotein OsmB